MDEMSQRIKEKSHLVAQYVKSNGPRLYKWGLTDHELDCFLYTALWQTVLYLDEHDDDISEYQRFWRFARRELSKAWRELNHVKGLPGESLYQLHEEPDIAQSEYGGNPEQLAGAIESLESLTDRQKAILSAIGGSGNRRAEAVAESLGEASGDVVLKQLEVVRTVIKTGEAPNTEGIKVQIIDYLGLEHGKSASIRAKNVLAVARRELDISIPRGSRYNRKQCDQIMAWLEANARAQWFQANNPVQASTG